MKNFTDRIPYMMIAMLSCVIGFSALVLGIGIRLIDVSFLDRTKLDSRISEILINQFSIHQSKAVSHSDLKNIPRVLVDLNNVFPSINLDWETTRAIFDFKSNCISKNKNSNSIEIKNWDQQYKIWFKFEEAICNGSTPPKELLESAGFFHPLGGTWSAYILADQPSIWQSNHEWIAFLKSRLHILERDIAIHSKIDLKGTNIPLEIYDTFSSVDSHKLSTAILGDNVLAAFEQKILILPLKTIQSLFSWGAYKFNAESCLAKVDSSCFVKNDLMLYLFRKQTLIFSFGFAFLIFSFIAFYLDRYRLKSQFHEYQEMLVQTLTHELRHPATSLRLSAEVLRDSFDSLPEQIQFESLRMLDQIQKLQRVLDKSKQYLESQSPNKEFQLDRQIVADFHVYVESLLENYLEKITFEKVGYSAEVTIDKYWFGVCVVNLVKNALIHGQAPIKVVSVVTDNSFKFEVFDSGPPPELTFEQMIIPLKKGSTSKGMGIGLGLVFRLMKLMNGSFVFTPNPKSFTLEIPRTNSGRLK